MWGIRFFGLSGLGLTALILAALLFSPNSHAQDTPSILLPVIPSRVFSISDYGAVGDGKTVATTALQKTIDTCAQFGGGTVRVPAGRFLIGPTRLTSNLNLHLDKGATLLLTTDPADYALPDKHNRQGIEAAGCHDVALTGDGTIDGQGAAWWPRYAKNYVPPTGAPAPIHRPYLVVFRDCVRVLVEGVTLTNSPSFHLVPAQCRDVTIRDLEIVAPANAPNTDGIDPSGWNVTIMKCTIDVGDDCIAIKGTGPHDMGHASCENFTISHCAFRHGHGLSIGGQTPGGVRHLRVLDCTFEGTQAGIRLKAGRGYGGVVEDLVYENLSMNRVGVPILISSYYPRIPADPSADPAQPVTATTPIWRDIHIRDVSAQGSDIAGRILGLSEAPVSGVTLTGVHISAKKGMEIVHARGIHFEASSVTSANGPAIVSHDAEVTGLTGVSASPLSPAKEIPPVATGNSSLIVAVDGSAPYRSVQAAIDAAPAGAPGHPTVIRIHGGTYHELIHIPPEKPFLSLAGDDAAKTIVRYDLYASLPGADGKPIGTFRTATATIAAADFAAENITFENAAGPKGQALAIRIDGDRAVFRNCRFLGWQDTILGNQGRHYFANCLVAGAVDFIFGAATEFYQNCEIRVLGSGYITAASTPKANPWGFVFSHCRITAAAPELKTYLGRPWRPDASVYWIDTEMAGVVRPIGWHNWNDPAREKTARYGEYGSTGLGANPAARAPWAKTLTASESQALTPETVLAGADGWKPAQERAAQ